MPLDTAFTACLHDCPSTCALVVEILDPARVGRVRGAADNSYTAGAVCAKVARHAERVHHPDRLTQPLRRAGEKGNPVRLGNWRGSVVLHTEPLDGLQPGGAAFHDAAIWPEAA